MHKPTESEFSKLSWHWISAGSNFVGGRLVWRDHHEAKLPVSWYDDPSGSPIPGFAKTIERVNKTGFVYVRASSSLVFSKFIARDGEDNNMYQILKVPTGEWIRMAIVSNWDSDGWYEVWADLDQNGSMTRVVNRQSGIDFMGGRPSSSAGIGLYHHMDLFDGSVSGQPRQETVYTDYANVQITSYQP